MSIFKGASIMLGDTGNPRKDYEIPNLHHFRVLLARVYSKVADKISPERVYTSEDIHKIIMENNLLALYAKKNKVSDCDVVSIFEAVKWAIYYVQNSEALNIKPILVKDTDHDKAVDSADVHIFNCFVIDDDRTEKEFYPEYNLFDKGHVLSIIKWAQASYTAEFEKGE